MPSLAPRPCTYPGCGRLVRDGTGRCESHKFVERRQSDARRGSASARGYGSAWQRARAAFLADHPLCVRCERLGLDVASTVVDHIKAHKGDQHLFWSRSNWQALCKPCHDVKTATEDGGFGR